MALKKIINVTISGILTILTLVIIISFGGLIQWLAAKFIVMKFIWISTSFIAAIFVIGIVWAGIYDIIRKNRTWRNI